MSYVVLLLLSVGVTVYALVDCWRSTDDEVRGLPRPAWILLIILVGPLGIPAFGSVAYLLFGRPVAIPRRGRRVPAPDDDPEFLRRLDDARFRATVEERRREQRERKERERADRERRERERAERQQRRDQRRGEAEADPAGSGPEDAGQSPP